MAEDVLSLNAAFKNVFDIIIHTNNLTAVKSLANPYHQSGQGIIRRILDQLVRCKAMGVHVKMRWIPSFTENIGTHTAKTAAKRATKQDAIIQQHPPTVPISNSDQLPGDMSGNSCYRSDPRSSIKARQHVPSMTTSLGVKLRSGHGHSSVPVTIVFGRLPSHWTVRYILTFASAGAGLKPLHISCLPARDGNHTGRA